jgi:hypothetical protein
MRASMSAAEYQRRRKRLDERKYRLAAAVFVSTPAYVALLERCLQLEQRLYEARDSVERRA